MPIRPIDIPRYDGSAKRRFDEMTFRENDVAPINVAVAINFSEITF